MCGFVAMFDEAGGVQRETLLSAVRRIGHRGPDAEGLWVSEDSRAALAHARLAITDLSSGQQPISDELGRIWAVVNGEFYEFESIRRQLESRGHVFRTGSDSEILVHLYEDHGRECLAYLRGEFAFVVWDAQRRRLFAARDRFGVKPLFYAQRRASLLLASEAKALLAAGIEPAWDHAAYLQHLFMVHGQSQTLFKGVQQVPAGHYLEASFGGVEVRRYWDLDYPHETASMPNEAEADADEFGAALRDAVRVRLRSDVPLACFLSGGIDSSSVLSIAARATEKRIKAVTITFEPAIYDEGEIARRVAENAGVEYHPVHLTHADLADAFPDAVYHAETMGNMHGVARYLQSRFTRDSGCKVALTGDGADETLGGYSHFRLDLLNEPRHVPKLLEGIRSKLGFVPAWISKLASERAACHALMAPEVLAGTHYENVYGGFLDGIDVEHGCRGRHPLFQSMYIWCKSMLPNYSLCADRLEMAFSVECRHPFLDHRLFDTIKVLRPEQLIRNGTEKHVLREAARPFLPAEVYGRQKHPFAAPPATRDVAGPVMALIQDVLRGEVMRAVPFFCHAAVVEFLDEVLEMPEARRVAYEPLLMMLLCTALLQERYRLC